MTGYAKRHPRDNLLLPLVTYSQSASLIKTIGLKPCVRLHVYAYTREHCDGSYGSVARVLRMSNKSFLKLTRYMAGGYISVYHTYILRSDKKKKKKPEIFIWEVMGRNPDLAIATRCGPGKMCFNIP